MKPQIGIIEKNRAAVAQVLSKVLSDATIIHVKTKNAHWNLEGVHFYEKHTFFDIQIHQLAEIIDKVAERIRMIGHYAPATLKEYLELTQLTEKSSKNNDCQGFIKELLGDHEAIIIHLRENILPFGDTFKDFGSADFITGMMEEHEKMAWFLRSHLSDTQTREDLYSESMSHSSNNIHHIKE